MPGQWAVQTALGGVQSIFDLTAPTGRLGRQRQAIIEGVARSRVPPASCRRAARSTPSPASTADALPHFDDNALRDGAARARSTSSSSPARSFNVHYNDHFRLTLLPDEETIHTVFQRIEALLAEMS